MSVDKRQANLMRFFKDFIDCDIFYTIWFGIVFWSLILLQILYRMSQIVVQFLFPVKNATIRWTKGQLSFNCQFFSPLRINSGGEQWLIRSECITFDQLICINFRWAIAQWLIYKLAGKENLIQFWAIQCKKKRTFRVKEGLGRLIRITRYEIFEKGQKINEDTEIRAASSSRIILYTAINRRRLYNTKKNRNTLGYRQKPTL